MKDTVNYKGFEFEYDLYYDAEETHCAESFEITGITLNGVDASELLEDQIDEFEQFIINELKIYNPY